MLRNRAPRLERRSRGRPVLGDPRSTPPPRRVRSARLSSQRLTPGRGGYPGGRGAHWDFARPLPFSARPSAPPVPSPATASLRAGPLRASALSLPTSEAARLLARPPRPYCPASGGGTPPTARCGLSPAILGRSTPAQLRKRRLVDAPRTP